MAVPLYLVDAFTATPFRGNPASVCLLERDLSADVMQAIAAEMNHSETAFARPLDGTFAGATRFALRWFTPKAEVPLCGHATLATAAVIFRERGNQGPLLVFDTLSGPLAAARDRDRIVLDFPAADVAPAVIGADVLSALGIDAALAVRRVRSGRILLLHVEREAQVRALTPDLPRLIAARGDDSFLGVIVTATGSAPYDFVSRYFAPWIGVDEDPVTGSAHCALAPYWAPIAGRTEMRAFQASPRGGDMTVRVRGDRVDLTGDAVIVAAGELRL